MPRYYVLKEFYAGGYQTIHAHKHQIIEMPEHRGREFVQGGLLRELPDIAPSETIDVRPSETKKANVNRKKK